MNEKPKYNTHICKTDTGLTCTYCKCLILLDDEFAVTITPSRPHVITCLACTDKNLDDGTRSFRVCTTVGAHPGTARAA